MLGYTTLLRPVEGPTLLGFLVSRGDNIATLGLLGVKSEKDEEGGARPGPEESVGQTTS